EAYSGAPACGSRLPRLLNDGVTGTPSSSGRRTTGMDRIAGWADLKAQIQNLLEYEFRKEALLREALTHSSFSNDDRKLNGGLEALRDNERLEFLGDAVIGLVVAQLLMQRFPDASEGRLSRWRSHL